MWLKEYNHIRHHQSLNMRPPVPETLNQPGTLNGGWTDGRLAGRGLEEVRHKDFTDLALDDAGDMEPRRNDRRRLHTQHKIVKKRSTQRNTRHVGQRFHAAQNDSDVLALPAWANASRDCVELSANAPSAMQNVRRFMDMIVSSFPPGLDGPLGIQKVA